MTTLWQTIKFGVKSIALQRASAKPRGEILRLQRERLQRLVRHASAFSPFYRDKFARLNPSQFELHDLPRSTKAELMDNFNDSLTVRDVR